MAKQPIKMPLSPAAKAAAKKAEDKKKQQEEKKRQREEEAQRREDEKQERIAAAKEKRENEKEQREKNKNNFMNPLKELTPVDELIRGIENVTPKENKHAIGILCSGIRNEYHALENKNNSHAQNDEIKGKITLMLNNIDRINNPKSK